MPPNRRVFGWETIFVLDPAWYKAMTVTFSKLQPNFLKTVLFDDLPICKELFHLFDFPHLPTKLDCEPYVGPSWCFLWFFITNCTYKMRENSFGIKRSHFKSSLAPSLLTSDHPFYRVMFQVRTYCSTWLDDDVRNYVKWGSVKAWFIP